MGTKTRISNAERFGRWLGHVWRSYVRRERRVAGWLVTRGIPAGGATTLLWLVKLGVLAIFFYVALWLALLLFAIVVAAWAAHNATPPENEQDPEWRMGLTGYGLYRGDIRIDPGNADDED